MPKKITPESIREMHVKNGIICRNCKHRKDVVSDFWTSGHFFYCEKQPSGAVPVGVTTGDGFCNEWEKKDDDQTGI